MSDGQIESMHSNQPHGTPRLRFVPGYPRIAYEESGDGEVIVFLHGIGGNRTNWRAQLAFFGCTYRAVAWDARGYGDSDDYDGPFDFAEVSDDLRRLLDVLVAERAHLVGLSMGGRILMDFAVRYPERIASLTIAAAFPSFGQALSPAQREEFVRLRLAPITEGRTFDQMAPALVDALLGPLAPPETRSILGASIASLRAQSYSKAVSAAVDFDRMASLGSIQVPVKLLCGEHDRLVPPAMMRIVEAAIPNAECSVLADAGHLLNLECPDEFNRQVAKFIDTLRTVRESPSGAAPTPAEPTGAIDLPAATHASSRRKPPC